VEEDTGAAGASGFAVAGRPSGRGGERSPRMTGAGGCWVGCRKAKSEGCWEWGAYGRSLSAGMGCMEGVEGAAAAEMRPDVGMGTKIPLPIPLLPPLPIPIPLPISVLVPAVRLRVRKPHLAARP
jgi:hypothetical protein